MIAISMLIKMSKLRKLKVNNYFIREILVSLESDFFVFAFILN